MSFFSNWHVHVYGRAYVAEFLGQERSRLNLGSSYCLGLVGVGQRVHWRRRLLRVAGVPGRLLCARVGIGYRAQAVSYLYCL